MKSPSVTDAFAVGSVLEQVESNDFVKYLEEQKKTTDPVSLFAD
jgi:hypothetical protein